MLTALYALLAFSSVVIADVAVTSPTNGSSISSGQQVQFNWYSDDENEGRQFDIALMSLRQLGEYQVTNRQISEMITIPSDTPSGSYYLGINELDNDANNNANDRGLDDYDLRVNVDGQIGSRATTIEVTGGNTRRRRMVARQNNADDEVLYSPTNSSVAAGSSFNFTYRCDDENTRSVLVGLVRAYTGNTAPTSTSERTSWEGSITIPDNLANGDYYVAVYADDNEAPSLGEYDLSFSTNAQLRGNDVEITGNEVPLILSVGGNGASSGTGSSAAASGTVSGAAASASNPATAASSSPVTVSGASTPSGAAMVGAKVPVFGTVIGGLIAWAII